MYLQRHAVVALLMVSLLGGLSTANAQQTPLAEDTPQLGLEGYCPVCIVEARKWMKGSPEHAAEYDGRIYQFPGEDQRQMFLKNPGKYVPALGGDCTVCYANMQKRMPGNIRFGVFYQKRLFLFPSDKQRTMFKAKPAAFGDTDLALGGNCAVCLVEMKKNVPGKSQFTAHHRGMRYQFPSDKERAMFLSNPTKYAVDTAAAGQPSLTKTSAKRISVVGTSGCAGCEHGVHPLGAPDTLGLAVNSSDGNVYIVEDAHRMYAALYENRFEGYQLRVDGEVVRRDGKFVWVQPESLERVR